jgi:sugar O-acyltransferase (sialic acid O-acetyltransferase NeuD family)
VETKGLLLIGASGHAHSCIEVIESANEFQVLGLIGVQAELDVDSVLGHAVIGKDAELESLREKYTYAHIGIGQIKTPSKRISVFNLLRVLKYELPVIVSPKSMISRFASIGDGTIVMHGAIVNSNAQIGENCIINSAALVEHDVIIHNHCHISTGALVNGGVLIGEGTFIGSGAMIKQGVKIGRNCVIEMGSKIFADIADGSYIK